MCFLEFDSKTYSIDKGDDDMERTLLRSFSKYVSFNILGMLGISCYILADTFFVAKALGATGIAALNFSISIYSIIHGIGLMLGIGGATRYSILKAQHNERKADGLLSTSIKFGIIVGLVLIIIGLLGTKHIAIALGADQYTLPLTQTYLITILSFAPFFILNNIMLAFVRNDNNPNLAMIAMLTGSFSNIILDYVLLFPLKMGMFGAAFATGLAPVISIGILLMHFMKKKDKLLFLAYKLEGSMLPDILRLGLSAFVIEISSAVVLITFNLVILRLEGNLGVAAYGIIANIALVGVAIFTGLAQGVQPLTSFYYGLQNVQVVRKVLKYALMTSLLLAIIIYLGIYLYSDGIVALFNEEKNPKITEIAEEGLRIYFLGFFFAGINIVTSIYFSSTEKAIHAFVLSILRGFVVLVPIVLLLSSLWKITGIWFAFLLTELFVTILALCYVAIKRRKQE
jgi:putative MATE family efflux protein